MSRLQNEDVRETSSADERLLNTQCNRGHLLASMNRHIGCHEDAEAVSSRSEGSEVVRVALVKMTADQRAILVLRVRDNLTYEEIAELLGITVDAVRGRLSRARQRLRVSMSALQRTIP